MQLISSPVLIDTRLVLGACGGWPSEMEWVTLLWMPLPCTCQWCHQTTIDQAVHKRCTCYIILTHANDCLNVTLVSYHRTYNYKIVSGKVVWAVKTCFFHKHSCGVYLGLAPFDILKIVCVLWFRAKHDVEHKHSMVLKALPAIKCVCDAPSPKERNETAIYQIQFKGHILLRKFPFKRADICLLSVKCWLTSCDQ